MEQTEIVSTTSEENAVRMISCHTEDISREIIQ